jgi:lipoyl(octanoyl) transferase
MQVCHVRCLGLVPYQQAWDLQAELADKIAAGLNPPTLLLLEHPHTFTFGRRGQVANLLWSEAELKQHGIEVYWVDRGGDVTYHGPGQLVGYPLIPLRMEGLMMPHMASSTYVPHADYTGYLHKLEQVLIHALSEFGVKAETIKNLTGVWVNGAKLAAIGVKVDSHGITRHGFALNVAPDMTYWDGIIACGLDGLPVTSLARLLPEPPPIHQVIQAVVRAFENLFEVKCVVVS